MDLVQHVAIVDVLLRLWRDDAAVQTYYAFALQPVGYHLFYALSFVLGLGLGALRAVQLVQILTLGAHIAVCRWVVRKEAGALLPVAIGIHTFYCAHYTFGFVVTAVATPAVLAAVALLARGARGRRDVAALVGCALWATLGHVIFAPLLVVAALAAWAVHGRRMQSAALGSLFATALCLAPALLSRGHAVLADAPGAAVTFDHAWAGLRHLYRFSCGIDRNVAQLGWSLFILVNLGLALRHRKAASSTPERKFLQGILALCLAALWLVPYRTGGSVGSSLLLNVRWLCLLPLLSGLLVQTRLTALAPPLRLRLAGFWALTSLCVLGGVMRLTLQYRSDIDAFAHACEQIPNGARMCATSDVGDTVDTASAWPSLRYNMSLLAFPGRLAFHSGMFNDGHLPVQIKNPHDKAACETATKAFATELREGRVDLQGSEALWAHCDVLFVQGTEVDSLAVPSEPIARTLATGDHWRLFAAPTR